MPGSHLQRRAGSIRPGDHEAGQLIDRRTHSKTPSWPKSTTVSPVLQTGSCAYLCASDCGLETGLAMDMCGLLVAMAFLLGRMQASRGENVTQATWRRVFTLDGVLSGHLTTLPALSRQACGVRCLEHSACASFAFQFLSETCWLYGRPVVYGEDGVAAPGTEYFWRQRGRCPLEAGFVQASGLCLYVSPYRRSWNASRLECAARGAHLYLADNLHKRSVLEPYANVASQVYIGATSMFGGVWRWEDGSLLSPTRPPWNSNQPSGDGQNCAVLIAGSALFDDIRDTDTRLFACEIPL